MVLVESLVGEEGNESQKACPPFSGDSGVLLGLAIRLPEALSECSSSSRHSTDQSEGISLEERLRVMSAVRLSSSVGKEERRLEERLSEVRLLR